MSEAFVSALKEMGRVLVLAIIPVVIPMFESWSVDWRVIATVGAIAVLRFIDKYLHENSPEGVSGGLTRF